MRSGHADHNETKIEISNQKDVISFSGMEFDWLLDLNQLAPSTQHYDRLLEKLNKIGMKTILTLGDTDQYLPLVKRKNNIDLKGEKISSTALALSYINPKILKEKLHIIQTDRDAHPAPTHCVFPENRDEIRYEYRVKNNKNLGIKEKTVDIVLGRKILCCCVIPKEDGTAMTCGGIAMDAASQYRFVKSVLRLNPSLVVFSGAAFGLRACKRGIFHSNAVGNNLKTACQQLAMDMPVYEFNLLLKTASLRFDSGYKLIVTKKEKNIQIQSAFRLFLSPKLNKDDDQMVEHRRIAALHY